MCKVKDQLISEQTNDLINEYYGAAHMVQNAIQYDANGNRILQMSAQTTHLYPGHQGHQSAQTEQRYPSLPLVTETAYKSAQQEEVKTQGIKHDQEKPDLSLLSSIAIIEVSKVMTFGKKKYTANNWRGGIVWTRLLAAALRHIFAFLGGESLDPESGVSHIAHAICCLMMLLEFQQTRVDLDDRYKSEKK